MVGIGLNLTSRPEDWPEELRPIAGSLYPGGPAPVSRAALAGAIARELLGLCPAFDCLDEYRKSAGSAENMRSQIQDYISDAARAKLAADKVKAENETLKRENAALREQLATLQQK